MAGAAMNSTKYKEFFDGERHSSTSGFLYHIFPQMGQLGTNSLFPHFPFNGHDFLHMRWKQGTIALPPACPSIPRSSKSDQAPHETLE